MKSFYKRYPRAEATASRAIFGAKAQSLAQQWLQPDDLILIVVGDQKKLSKQFASSAYPVYPLQLFDEQKIN